MYLVHRRPDVGFGEDRWCAVRTLPHPSWLGAQIIYSRLPILSVSTGIQWKMVGWRPCCVYREEAEDGMKLEKANVFFRNWGGGLSFCISALPLSAK